MFKDSGKLSYEGRLKLLPKKEDLQELFENIEAKLEQKFMKEIDKRDKKIAELQNSIGILHHKQIYNEYYRDLHTRLIDQNLQYSKKVNLIVTGINLSKSENNNQIKKKIIDEITRLNLDINEYEVDRAHRHGCTTDQRGNKRQ